MSQTNTDKQLGVLKSSLNYHRFKIGCPFLGCYQLHDVNILVVIVQKPFKVLPQMLLCDRTLIVWESSFYSGRDFNVILVVLIFSWNAVICSEFSLLSSNLRKKEPISVDKSIVQCSHLCYPLSQNSVPKPYLQKHQPSLYL